jgi:hypothetical protein
MHRVVIYINPVTSSSYGETLYGKLYAGNTESEILTIARLDYKTLTIRQEWEGEQGEEFRKREGWTLTYNEDGTESWWLYDQDRYSFHLGYDPIPDEFVKLCNSFAHHIALISRWVPLKMADCNIDDYITNGVFYDMVANANDIQWIRVDEIVDDELPF